LHCFQKNRYYAQGSDEEDLGLRLIAGRARSVTSLTTARVVLQGATDRGDGRINATFMWMPVRQTTLLTGQYESLGQGACWPSWTEWAYYGQVTGGTSLDTVIGDEAFFVICTSPKGQKTLAPGESLIL
jgi:hypothetical protein